MFYIIPYLPYYIELWYNGFLIEVFLFVIILLLFMIAHNTGKTALNVQDLDTNIQDIHKAINPDHFKPED